MAALHLKPQPDHSTASSDVVEHPNDTAASAATDADRETLLRDLVRALARTAAREAWALAITATSEPQEAIP